MAWHSSTAGANLTFKLPSRYHKSLPQATNLAANLAARIDTGIDTNLAAQIHCHH